MRAITAWALVACGLHAQSDVHLAFEVASVKHLPAGAPGGGGGRAPTPSAPMTVHYPSITLKDLVRRAWNVTEPQVSGPAWMDSERYSVIAKMPDGSNQGDIPRML